jgi:DNA-binding transcriptional ArsR family regulator
MRSSVQEMWMVLKALGHPTRVRMVSGLFKNECNVAQIQKKLRLPQSTISQHLRVLRDYGIIQPRQEGTKRCYRVVDKRVIKMLQIGIF